MFLEALPGEHHDFEKFLDETITDCLRELLGESSMKAIVFHLGIERVASDPQAFDKRLHELLGTPATVIEEVVIKELFGRLGLVYSGLGDFDFVKYVDTARKVFLSK